MEEVTDYKIYLTREFEFRRRRNSGYSLRAFARDLEIQPSKLSEILSQRVGMSTATAEKIAANLKLLDDESRHFISLVERDHGRSQSLRLNAQKNLESHQLKHN